MGNNGLLGVGLLALGLSFVACSPQETGSVAELALTEEVKARPFIRYQCYFFEVPDGFLKSEGQELGDSMKTYSQAEGNELLKKLQKKRGCRLTPTPAVKCRSGQIGRMELGREFIYPTEYSPPGIPEGALGKESVFPVTPSMPSKFEQRRVGLEASFQGRIQPDGVVAFEYDVQRSDFLGFINYGSPITAGAKGLFGQAVEVVVTENRIEMPVFDTKRISSQATLSHGQYLALGKWGVDFQPGLDKVKRAGLEGLEKSPNLFVLIEVQLSD